MYSLTSLSLLAAVAHLAVAQVTLYGQCGGINWGGSTTCVSGATCVQLNPYYYQCLPGTQTSSKTTPATSPPKPTTTTATTRIFSTITGLPSTTTSSGIRSTTVSGGSGPGSTLRPGYYWIRAVAEPNYHKYLQTSPQNVPGTAILGDNTSAGQFNIVDGQLVELVDPAAGTVLYANVSPQTDSSQTKLAVAFSTTKNTYGTFAYQGDTVTWSVSSIKRPNSAAWLVCTGQALFVNLGSYGYMTPAGCADQTIHSYGAPIADV